MNDIEAAEREAFAKYITSQEHIGFDAVVWRGIGGDPLGVLHEPEYSENSLRSEWAAWLARSALAHAARGEPVRGWRDREGTLPARRDGDQVARVDEMVPWFLAPTPPPATGEAERCEDHGREGCIDCEPATGEAGTRGEGEVGAHAMDVAERCYYAIKGGAPYRDSIRAMAAIIEAERPLPEAREGGGK